MLKDSAGGGLNYAITNFFEAAYDRSRIEWFEPQVILVVRN